MSWNPKYVVLILTTTLVSYLAALLIERYKQSKKIILMGTLIVCMGILFFFKYYNFLSQSVCELLNAMTIRINPVTLKVLLPVGISFYTFQTLSYVIDVYRGNIEAEKHFGIYATFVSFFPQLVAGPIERTENLLPQIRSNKVFQYDQASYGMKLMAWGFFKKMVISDNLAQYVDVIFESPQKYSGFSYILAAMFFAIQIYCDFSGYSDIAIGTSKLMGINLMTNFRSPYFSSSIKEFWSRWHISLSTWFRDYVYIPLGGNRVGKVRHKINLIITFLASGLWHGANWTFVIWGGLHGIAQAFENMLGIKSVKKDERTALWWIRVIIVFVFCSLAWIFFRATTISDAIYMLTHWQNGILHPGSYFIQGIRDTGIHVGEFVKLLILILILAVYDYKSLSIDVIQWISKKKTIIRYAVYFVLIISIICFKSSNDVEFVYFQF